MLWQGNAGAAKEAVSGPYRQCKSKAGYAGPLRELYMGYDGHRRVYARVVEWRSRCCAGITLSTPSVFQVVCSTMIAFSF